MSSTVHCLEPGELDLFLERRRRGPSSFPTETSLADNLVQILSKANDFVASDAGSILLDDPTKKIDERQFNNLTFIAAFGEKAAPLLGRKIKATDGIAGHVYLNGRSHRTSNARQDELFYAGIDEATDFNTESLVAIPIRVGDDVCGVLELIRGEAFSENECRLLEIFAGYISISIQNVLDARQAQAIAKRDNLTTLYNDRYLHIALGNAVASCFETKSDLAVLFLDLDYFKRVNDTYGHLAGSQVLREVGGILGRKARSAKGLAARYGGDEFVVVLPHSDLRAAIDFAEEVRNHVVTTTFCRSKGSIQPDPLHLRGLTCSIGVATLRRHLNNENPDQAKTTLLRLADSAMYVAKETGRNRTAVAGEPVRRRIDAEVKKALSREAEPPSLSSFRFEVPASADKSES